MSPTEPRATPLAQTFFHGTKADLKIGDLIDVGFRSNFGRRGNARYIFLTSTLDAAIWGAELASGDGRGRIYLVEATGPIEDDPDLTDQRFPGNPSLSYRSAHPFRVVGEVGAWVGHSPEQIRAMRDGLDGLNERGVKSLNE
jgi:rifampin ADP-ribosylating transferase